jgi:hypothetical protein
VVDEELLNEMKSDASSSEADQEEEGKTVEEEFAMEDGTKSDKEHSFKSDKDDKEGASDIESDFEGDEEEYDENFLAEFEADLKNLAAEMEAQGVKVPEG